MGEVSRYQPEEPSSQYLKVLLLYEDEETGLRAHRSLALVQREVVEEYWRVRLWRRDLLQTAWLRQQAAKEAASSDVVIISLHGHEELSPELRDWVTAWLQLKLDHPCALGVLLDFPAAADPSSHSTAAYLRTIAEEAGVDLLWGFYGTASAGSEHSSLRAREAMAPFLNQMDQRTSNSHWGINE